MSIGGKTLASWPGARLWAWCSRQLPIAEMVDCETERLTRVAAALCGGSPARESGQIAADGLTSERTGRPRLAQQALGCSGPLPLAFCRASPANMVLARCLLPFAWRSCQKRARFVDAC